MKIVKKVLLAPVWFCQGIWLIFTEDVPFALGRNPRSVKKNGGRW